MTPEKNIEYHGSGNVFPRLALAVFMAVSSVSCAIHGKVVGVDPVLAENPTGMPQVPKTGPYVRVKLASYKIEDILKMTSEELNSFTTADFYDLTPEEAKAICNSELFEGLGDLQRMAVLHKAVFGGENEENAEVD